MVFPSSGKLLLYSSQDVISEDVISQDVISQDVFSYIFKCKRKRNVKF